jgi:hypothetical protein
LAYDEFAISGRTPLDLQAVYRTFYLKSQAKVRGRISAQNATGNQGNNWAFSSSKDNCQLL